MSNQMQEIEAKFYVLDIKTIEMCLQDLEARLIQPRVLETNIRFDLPDGGLRSEGRVLRLRQDADTKLTYKDAGKNEQGVVNRTEIEFVVEDFEKAKNFLEALGYQKLIQYDKYRTTYNLDTCYIMLDELPYGNFVEIEGEDIATIHNIAQQLNLDLRASILTGYIDLFENTRKTLGLTFTDLTFANFTGIQVTPAHLHIQPADANQPRNLSTGKL
jgi:adenylate cyclase class 2